VVEEAVPATALQHFQEDIERARALIDLAETKPAGTVAARLIRGDVLRSAWMFSVGALDAYFCDAYSDVIAYTIISKNRHAEQNPPGLALPDFFLKVKFPIRAILEPYDVNTNWRWRMAAREMMTFENVLSIETVQKLFNPFFRDGRKFFYSLLPNWIAHPNATRRLFGISGAAFAPLAGNDRQQALRLARDQFEDRFEALIQRRHDCIHNCDRPRMAPQPLSSTRAVRRVADDVEFLVRRFDEHCNVEFREFLLGLGCPVPIVNLTGY
jgi:hypothetical protein